MNPVSLRGFFMEYIDIELMDFIEQPDVSMLLDYWVSEWEATLGSKFLLGATGSKINHQIRVVGSQIVIITTSSTVSEPYQMRLRLKDRNFQNPQFEPISPEEWYHPPEEKELN